MQSAEEQQLQEGFRQTDFWEAEEAWVRVKAVLHLMGATVVILLLVSIGFGKNAGFYDYLTAASIGVTGVIAGGYLRGIGYQADASVDGCCDKAGRSASIVLTLIITAWLILFFVVLSGAMWSGPRAKIIFNLIAASIVYAGYVYLDHKAYAKSYNKRCGQIRAGLPQDVKRSFWQVDLPTFLAVLLFSVATLWFLPDQGGSNWMSDAGTIMDRAVSSLPGSEPYCNELQSCLKKGSYEVQAAFAQGGLALLMFVSSFAFGLGFPKYVLVFAPEVWFGEDVCERNKQFRKDESNASVEQLGDLGESDLTAAKKEGTPPAKDGASPDEDAPQLKKETE